MRAVFDTNVLVAAFAADGLCAKLLRRANRRDFTLLVCPVILGELERALRKKLGASDDEVAASLALVREVSTTVEDAPSAPVPGPRRSRIARDPDDDLILRCAEAARAEVLVTGDGDLLVLGKHGRVKIIDPRRFELLFR